MLIVEVHGEGETLTSSDFYHTIKSKAEIELIPNKYTYTYVYHFTLRYTTYGDGLESGISECLIIV